MSGLSTVLKARRRELGLTLLQIAQAVGVTEATVQRWESGNIKTVRPEKLERLAQILQVSPTALTGWGDNVSPMPGNLTRLTVGAKVPLVGTIACGTPILAEENIAEYVDLPGHIRADFALTCQGDSMLNAGIRDSDIVYIRQQDTVENGQIAAVLVDGGEATLKRFYRQDNRITLNAENPAYPPMVFVDQEMERVRIIGLAVAFIHVLT